MDLEKLTDLELAFAVQKNFINKQQILQNEYLLSQELERRLQVLGPQPEKENGSM